jgi:hypothetical protein
MELFVLHPVFAELCLRAHIELGKPTAAKGENRKCSQ